MKKHLDQANIYALVILLLTMINAGVGCRQTTTPEAKPTIAVHSYPELRWDCFYNGTSGEYTFLTGPVSLSRRAGLEMNLLFYLQVTISEDEHMDSQTKLIKVIYSDRDWFLLEGRNSFTIWANGKKKRLKQVRIQERNLKNDLVEEITFYQLNDNLLDQISNSTAVKVRLKGKKGKITFDLNDFQRYAFQQFHCLTRDRSLTMALLEIAQPIDN